MSLKNLTIACVTYNRHKYISRLIDYWQMYFKESKIFIIDGTPNSLPSEYLSKIKSSKIKYIYMPKKSLFSRYCFIKKILKTRYFQMVADDEIFLRSGVIKSIKFLEKNQDYSSCCGDMILFTPLLKKHICAFSPYKLYSNNNSDSIERVKKWLIYSQPNTIYSIVRSDYYLNVLNQFCKFNVANFSEPENFFEELIEIGLSYQGKTKKLNNLMWLRSIENPRIGLGNENNRPENCLYDKAQINKKIIFDAFIKKFLVNISKNKNSKLNFDLNFFFYKRLRVIRENKEKKKISSFLKRIQRSFFKYIPKIIKEHLRYLLKLNGIEVNKFLKKNNKIKFNHKEILNFKKFILNFHNSF